MIPCPNCASMNSYVISRAHHASVSFKCKNCKKNFNNRTGTKLACCKLTDEKIDLIFKTLETDPKISSLKLADLVGVTQKTAWLWIKRLREENAGPSSLRGYYQGANRWRARQLESTAAWKRKRVAPWSREKQLQFSALWESGISAAEIGIVFDIRAGSVSDMAKVLGLAPRASYRGVTRNEIFEQTRKFDEDIVFAISAGDSTSNIARALEKTESFVKRRAYDHKAAAADRRKGNGKNLGAPSAVS